MDQVKRVTVYVSIGNSDDKLTQKEWADYLFEVDHSVMGHAAEVHGQWFSSPRSPFQNAGWCFEIGPEAAGSLRRSLARHAGRFRQDSIAWAEAQTTFIGPAT
jgi:hypothetical protein